jgi:outer membrane protein
MRAPHAFVICVLAFLSSQAARSETLADIYQLARKNDPTLAQAEANRRAVREAKPQAIGALLPQITGAVSYALDGVDSTSERVVSVAPGVPPFSAATVGFNHSKAFDWSARLTQSLFHWDQWVKLRQADKQAVQADLDYHVAELDLFLRISTAYFAVLQAQDTLQADQAAKEAIGRQLEQAQKRFEVGLIAITDVQEAQAGYDQAVATEIVAKRVLANSKEALRAITGEYPGELAGPKSDLEPRSPDPLDEKSWVDTALKQNYSLQSAQLGAEIARANVGIARGGHIPTIDLVAQHVYDDTNGWNNSVARYTGQSVPTIGDANSGRQDNNISVQMSVPIFSSGITQSRVRQAVYQHRAAKSKLEATARETQRQARDAFLGVNSDISNVAALKQAVKSAETALQATQAGFEVGTRTTVEVLTGQQNLVQAQTNFAKSRYDYILDVLRLKQAAGTLDDKDLAEINGWLK